MRAYAVDHDPGARAVLPPNQRQAHIRAEGGVRHAQLILQRRPQGGGTLEHQLFAFQGAGGVEGIRHFLWRRLHLDGIQLNRDMIRPGLLSGKCWRKCA